MKSQPQTNLKIYFTRISLCCVLMCIFFTIQVKVVLQLDPIPLFYIVPNLVGAFFGYLLSSIRIKSDSIKTLTGMIPICSYCHKIRDSEGLWGRLEKYIEQNSEASISHGVCQECKSSELKKLGNK